MAEESELVVAGDVVAEVMEREAGAEAAADEPRGWLSSLREPQREGGAEASKPETEQAAGGAIGSVEFLGRWNEKKADPAMPGKMRGYDVSPRLAFGKLVEELVQKNAPSGIFAISEESYTKEFPGPPARTM